MGVGEGGLRQEFIGDGMALYSSSASERALHGMGVYIFASFFGVAALLRRVLPNGGESILVPRSNLRRQR